MGSSRIRDWTRVSCVGRQTLNHWTTREVPPPFAYFQHSSPRMTNMASMILISRGPEYKNNPLILSYCVHVCACSLDQLHRTLCEPMDYSPSGSTVTGVGCHFLLRGIFPTQGSNLHLLCLLHSRWLLYPLSHCGSPVWVWSIWGFIFLTSSLGDTDVAGLGAMLWEPLLKVTLSHILKGNSVTRNRALLSVLW